MLAFVMIFDLLTSSNAVTFSLVVPDGSISGPLGSSVVLPCILSPSLDCKQYKISWYRPDNDDIQVLLYEDLKVKENDGDPQYRGRVSLVGDLQKGNISLKLENLTLADRGEYVCFVNAYKWYEMASVFTSVTVVGSAPYLSLAEVGDQVNVTCASDGWSPKPTLIWRDKRGKELKNITDNYLKDSEGLVSVRSWLMFSPSDSEWISCSVGLSDQEIKEGRVVPLKILQSGWKAAFIVLLVISVLVISLLICLMFRVWQKHSKSSNTDKEKHLIGEINPPPCAVCTERELNRADGETQTSGPETLDKKTSTDKEIQAGSVSGQKVTPKQEKANTLPKKKDPTEQEKANTLPKKKDQTEQGKANTLPKKKDQTEQGKAGSVSSKKDPTEQEKTGSVSSKKDPTEQEKTDSVSSKNDSSKQGKVNSLSGKNDSSEQGKANTLPKKKDQTEQEKAGSVSEQKDPPEQEKANTLPKKKDKTEQEKDSLSKKEDGPEQGKEDSVSTKKDSPKQEKADSASGDKGLGTGGETKEKLNSESDSASDPTDLSQTQDSRTDKTKRTKSKNNAAQPAPDNKDTSTAGPEPVNKNTSTGKNTKADSGTDNTNKTKGKNNAAQPAPDNKNTSTVKNIKEWTKMQDRKVAIKPDLRVKTHLGVLFKERIRAGQYYWEVHGLPGPSKPSASFRTYQQNKSPASWYVGVISETVLKNQLQLSPQNCWVLHYDEEKGFYVNDPSLTLVSVRGQMYSLGVYIDCEKHTLSFYNCDKRSSVYTFNNVDCTQPLVPVVFPGLKPQYSLDIS